MKKQFILMLAAVLLGIASPLGAERYRVTPDGAKKWVGAKWVDAPKDIAALVEGAKGKVTIDIESGFYPTLEIDFARTEVTSLNIVCQDGWAVLESHYLTDSRSENHGVNVRFHNVYSTGINENVSLTYNKPRTTLLPYLYVSPKGAGKMDGSSWENALPGKRLSKVLNEKEGDIVLFMKGGTYKPLMVKNKRLTSISMYGSIGDKDTYFGTGAGYGCKMVTSDSCVTQMYRVNLRGSWIVKNCMMYGSERDGSDARACTHIFVSPEGTGRRDGTSLADALPQSELQRAASGAKGEVCVFLSAGTYAPMSLRLPGAVNRLRIFGNFGGESVIESPDKDISDMVFSVQSDRPEGEEKARVHLKDFTMRGDFDFGNTKGYFNNINLVRMGKKEMR